MKAKKEQYSLGEVTLAYIMEQQQVDKEGS